MSGSCGALRVCLAGPAAGGGRLLELTAQARTNVDLALVDDLLDQLPSYRESRGAISDELQVTKPS